MKRKGLLLLLPVIAIAGIAIILLYPQKEYITIDGTQYLKNPDITTILLLGIENNETETSIENTAENGRSDTIILLVINDATQAVDLYRISRDTIVTVDIFTQDNELITSANMQLTMQYHYASNPEHGCELMAEQVGELLFGLPIDHTISISMDGIVPIIEEMAGVEVYMDKDYTYIHHAFIEGEVINLTGEMAELFIRYRDTNVTGGNEDRMERQLKLLHALNDKFKYQLRNPRIDVLYNIAAEAFNYIEGDLPLIPIYKVARYEINGEMYSLPGEIFTNSLYEEFYIDTEAVKTLVVDKFCVAG